MKLYLDNRGFSLPIILGILLLLTSMLGVLGSMETMDMALTIKSHRDRQFKLLENTAQDFLTLALQSDQWLLDGEMEINGCLDSTRYCYETTLLGVGTWGYVEHRLWDPLGTRDTITKEKKYRILARDSKEEDHSPDMIIYDSVINLGLAMSTEIQGRIHVFGAMITPVLRPEIAFFGTLKITDVSDSTDQIKDTMPNFRPVIHWVNRIQREEWNGSPILKCQQHSKSTIRITGGVKNLCLIKAKEVIIDGDPELSWSLIVADKIRIQGTPKLNHIQFYARETLIVELPQKQDSVSWYFLLPKSDSLPIPYIHFKTFSGRAFVSLPTYFKYGSPTLMLDSQSDILGEVWTNGLVDFRGKLIGKMRVGSLAGYEKGIMWLNTILGGHFNKYHYPTQKYTPLFWTAKKDIRIVEEDFVKP